MKQKVKYSPLEAAALRVLKGRTKPIETPDLVDRVYKLIGKEPPFNAQKAVIGLMGSLARKVKANKEAFVIGRPDRNGPHSISFWIAPK